VKEAARPGAQSLLTGQPASKDSCVGLDRERPAIRVRAVAGQRLSAGISADLPHTRPSGRGLAGPGEGGPGSLPLASWGQLRASRAANAAATARPAKITAPAAGGPA